MRSGSKLKSLKDDKDDIIHTKLMFSIMISGEQGDEVVKCRTKVRERRVLMETQWACRAFVSASCNIESFHHGFFFAFVSFFLYLSLFYISQWACRAFVSASCNIESFHHADNDGGDTFTFC